jgi:formylglycine-generating enzyme required for sulfatase activity
MKAEDISSSTGAQFELIDRRSGLTALTLIVSFVAIWLHVKGRSAVQTRTQPLPPISIPADSARFNGNFWHLPNEPLLGFVEIPAGAFVMGSDAEVDPMAFANERWSETSNQGIVHLPSFYIGRYEVTIGQFRQFVAATGREASALAVGGDLNRPVTHVSWSDAAAYSRWLEASMRESQRTPARLAMLLRDGWHIGLPNEAEWEKAARGSDGRIYPWGNMPNSRHANYRSSGSMPVGSFPCTGCAFELADMSGNVWELTVSPYLAYPFEARVAFEKLSGDALFVMRGGSFNDNENIVRVAVRGGVDPGVRNPSIGFRLALTRR